MDRSAFRKAVEARDLDQMMQHFAEDALLHSPVTIKPFEGRAAIRQLFGFLIEIFQEFYYTDQLEGDDGTLGLVFRARVDDKDAEGLDLLRFNSEGLIRDITVMVRPRSALEVLLEKVAARLAAAQSK